jgi:hypothetical protein
MKGLKRKPILWAGLARAFSHMAAERG